MKLKKISAMVFALMLSLGMFTTTAFAYTNESDTTEIDTVIEESTEEAETEPMNPLTPDGNLTLVDDEGVTTNGGKQFVTMVTKNGNYFYLIIDRDDKGNETKTFGIQVKSDTSYGLGASIKYAFQKFGSVYDSMVTVIGGLFTGKLS